MDKQIFQRYDDPDKARRIWDEYEDDFASLGIYNDAERILKAKKTAINWMFNLTS